MSLAKDLEIYKAADQLLALALQVQAQVPRAFRVAVGQRISNECTEVLLTIARANAARGQARQDQLARLLQHIEAATVLLRASHNLRIISTKSWAASIQLTDSIARQAAGWLNATARGQSHGPLQATPSASFTAAPAA